MTKTDFYSKYGLVPDSGTVGTSWGAIQPATGRYLLQCLNDEKTYIKKEDRTEDTIMIVKVLTQEDLATTSGRGPARVRTVAAIRGGATAYVAVSTGTYPNWIHSANLEQVYRDLSLNDKEHDVFARVAPLQEAFAQ